MKILVDARVLGRKPSGIGFYIYYFIKFLVTRKDFEIILITDVSESREMYCLENCGVHIVKFGKVIRKNLALLSYYLFVQKQIQKYKPEFFWEPNNLIPIQIKNPYGKYMVTIHDVFPLLYPSLYGKIYPVYFRYGLQRTVHSADIFLYNSKDTKESVERYFTEVKNKTSFLSYIIVIPLPEKPVSDGNYFFYMGNLEKRKGVDLLLKAYQKYRETGGFRKLYLAGKFRETELELLYHEVFGATKTVEYCGYVEEEKKAELFAGCSCFVFPSKAEGFGIPPIEAMSCLKPVIVSDLPVFHEILGETVNYVSIKGMEEDQIAHLCKAMHEFKNPSPQEYKRVLQKYEASVLGRKLADFLLDEEWG